MDRIDNECVEIISKAYLILRYYGVDIEDSENNYDAGGFIENNITKFTVPEFSTITGTIGGYDVSNCEDLKKLAKEVLSSAVLSCSEKMYGTGKDELAEMKQYMKFYAKVRKGEVWTKYEGEKALKKIANEVLDAKNWKEV